MSLVVIGSMAFDTVETPYGKRERVLGGSANYFSLSASFFTDVKLVAVVGEDFPKEHIAFLNERGISTEGLIQSSGETFHWSGRYEGDMNEAETLATELNVFADFDPTLPESYRDAESVFLANIDPELQLKVLEQIKSPKMVGLDTMNFWIHSKREALEKVISKVNMVFINDTEARELSGEHNIVRAAHGIQKMGATSVVIKRGEYGALFFQGDEIFFVPAFPLEDVRDPTGAGDTFAGGFMGWIDRNTADLSEAVARQAMLTGTIMASHVVEDFSFERMRTLTPGEITKRCHRLRDMAHIEGNFSLPES